MTTRWCFMHNPVNWVLLALTSAGAWPVCATPAQLHLQAALDHATYPHHFMIKVLTSLDQ